MARATSRGRCRYCGVEYGKSGMTRHLQSCQARKAAIDGAGKKGRTARFLHLAVSGRYAPMYWLHLEAPADATLADLDGFLRDIWLECCGHLSAFTIGGVSYSESPEDLGWWREERSMNVKLGKLLHVGDEFLHEYDFGSTTYLKLKMVGEREGPARGKDIEVMAQNEPPAIPCGVCGQLATQVCSVCAWEAEGWLCDACGEKHECGEEMFLPVVNSPRVGVCGYTG